MARNKPSTVRGNRITLKAHVLPALGKVKVADVKRSDVADLIGRLRDRPTTPSHCLSLLRKMFNLAELWGLRPDGTMRRAKEVDDTDLIPFVDTRAAARYLSLSPHSLECYRSLGGGPPFYKFGKFVRYAVPDLQAWGAERRHGRTAGEHVRVY